MKASPVRVEQQLLPTSEFSAARSTGARSTLDRDLLWMYRAHDGAERDADDEEVEPLAYEARASRRFRVAGHVVKSALSMFSIGELEARPFPTASETSPARSPARSPSVRMLSGTRAGSASFVASMNEYMFRRAAAEETLASHLSGHALAPRPATVATPGASSPLEGRARLASRRAFAGVGPAGGVAANNTRGNSLPLELQGDLDLCVCLWASWLTPELPFKMTPCKSLSLSGW